MKRALVALALIAGACQRGAAPAPIGDPPLPGITNVDRALAARLAAASAAPGTVGSRGAAPPFTNRLALESSPYLREHAHNPVNWYAWGPEAFARARTEHKPIFLSIGYATCHWCHVMALTVFDDEEVATYLNQQFVAIKVDREERPDVDDIYMRAVQAMTGRGGWPMTVIATPDGQPFFGGSYIPRAQILPLLHELRDAWDTRPDDVLAQAREVSARIAAEANAPSSAALPDASAIDGAVRAIGTGFDSAHGGFGGAPKFPEPPVLDLLLRAYRRSGDAGALAMATQTLDAIAAGAVHDPIGGGFHRYATDAAWRVPHFEKMLYDNAQLAMLYTEAWQVTGRDGYRALAIETLDFLDRELGDARGGFHAALDADSPGASGGPEEGAYYVWTYDQIVAIAGPAAAAAYGVAPGDDRAILYAAGPADPAARAALFAARAKRPRPPSDDELVASWNGLAISAFARAGVAFDRPDYVARAGKAADFVLASMRDDHGRLARAWVAGRAGGRGGLDDHAFVIAGLIDLFEATAEPRWLAAARTLARALDDDFGAPDRAGWFATANDAEALLARARPSYDGPEPSGNAVASLDLIRLATLADDDAMRARAERAIAAFAGAMTSSPSGTAGLWSALDADRTEPLEITIVGGADAAPLVDVVRRTYLPTRALALPLAPAQVDALASVVPFVGGKVARDGRATAYVCHRTRCDNPTGDPAVLEAQLAAPR